MRALSSNPPLPRALTTRTLATVAPRRKRSGGWEGWEVCCCNCATDSRALGWVDHWPGSGAADLRVEFRPPLSGAALAVVIVVVATRPPSYEVVVVVVGISFRFYVSIQITACALHRSTSRVTPLAQEIK